MEHRLLTDGRLAAAMQGQRLDPVVGISLAAVALIAAPVLGFFAGMTALQISDSLELHLAGALLAPPAFVVGLGRRWRVGWGLVVPLAVLATALSVGLLAVAWSGVR